MINIPGWITTYADPSLGSDAWELKEDLLQLEHPNLNRLADLGWYENHFSVAVFQGDFQGILLARRDVHDQSSALVALRELLEAYCVE